MPKENAITLHLPDDLADRVAALSAERKKSRPEVVRQILRQVFGG